MSSFLVKLELLLNKQIPSPSIMHSIEGFFTDLKSNNEHAASMQRTDKFSQFRSTIWSVWSNGLVFVYKLSSVGSSPLAVT